MKSFLSKLNWILSQQIGIDVRKLFGFFRGFFRFGKDYFLIDFEKSGVPVRFMPCVHDFTDQGGQAHTEYFWQDLLVARLIYQAAPNKHIDIGSRVDGFVAHVASFRDIEICDVRPIETKIPGVVFRQIDLMSQNRIEAKYDSVSCLHAMEHFGLGRYGDPLNLDGDRIGFVNLAELVAGGGVLYLSVPIGSPRIEFNANRVYHPEKIVSMAMDRGLRLQKFFYYGDKKNISFDETASPDWDSLAKAHYGLGLFVFERQLL